MTTIINKCDYDHVFRLTQKLILYTSKAIKMKKISLAFQTGLGILLPFAGMAHPGHGETEGFSIIHYFGEPVHATATAALLTVIMFSGIYIRRKKAQNKKS